MNQENEPLPQARHLTPPRVLAGLIKPIPLQLVERVAGHCLKNFKADHPQTLARLSSLDGKSLAVAPTDLPNCFCFKFHPQDISLRVARDLSVLKADTVIHGSIEDLIGLLEGRVDGDALFFNRQLRIDGDMEVMLAIRNAVDGANLTLSGLLLGQNRRVGSLFSPLLEKAGRLYRSFSHDLAGMETALAEPLQAKINRIENEIADLEEKIDRMRRKDRLHEKNGRQQ